MNFKLSGLAAAAALFTGFTVFSGFPGSASAASVRYANVGNWSIYSNETYCTATAEYEDDASLQFNVATNGAANIVIWNPRWKIPKGSHRVVASVDRTPPTTFQAEADGYHVSLLWELTEDQINLVSNGVVFRATIGREVYA